VTLEPDVAGKAEAASIGTPWLKAPDTSFQAGIYNAFANDIVAIFEE
jgi:hypothetical protein